MLQDILMAEMKAAMKTKDSVRLGVLRAIKAEFLKAKTSSDFNGEITEADEITLLTRMLKQRKDAGAIYKEQNREDLLKDEMDQAAVIMDYLPKQLSEEEVETEIKAIIAKVGATGPKDMGKVMGMASKAFAGKADGKLVASTVKSVLAAM